MSGIAGAGAGNGRTLVDQLLAVAGSAKRAAHFAEGEYLPQMSRQFELTRAGRDSERAADALVELGPSIAVLEGGGDGLLLARQALELLQSGRTVLRDGVGLEDGFVRGGTIVEDTIATGSASMLFREAEAKVRGIADLATMEAMSPDELFLGLTRPS